MSDLFHEKVEDEWLDQIFAVMALTPQHTYQILTKRSQRMLQWFKSEPQYEIEAAISHLYDDYPSDFHVDDDFIHAQIRNLTWPLPNVWLGVTVENQKAANERIPLLLETPAAIRFLSCEPLLEFVDLSRWLPIDLEEDGWVNYSDLISEKTFDWVICGGESGHGARPCNIEWLEEIVEQCLAADVPVFVKQLGSKPVGIDIKLSDKKGGDFNQFPETLQFRAMPDLGVNLCG